MFFSNRSIAILLAILAGSSLALADSPRPNVLLIMTDDQGYGDLSLHGNPVLRTPAMDSVGREGVRLDRFYVSPVCAPTRASLLTGRYHLRTGSWGVSRRQEVVDPAETTIAEVMRENGYATGCFGKWHNGAAYPETPNGQGFDEFFGFLGGVWREYYDPILRHNDEDNRYEGYITEILTDKAIDWMDEQIDRDQAFFCYLPYNAPHTPGLVDEEYWKPFYEKSVGRWESVIYGMIKSIDEQIARVLSFLETSGQEENTIVIFMTDNGPNTFRYTAGLKGKKAHIYEGGIRVPFFIRWPGTLKPHTVNQPLSHIDILPTVAELCNIDLNTPNPIDGMSFASLLRDPSMDWPDRQFISFSYGSKTKIQSEAAVHTNRWTAVQFKGAWSLYDIEADVRQRHDLSKRYPEVLDKLKSHWETELATMPPLGVETPVPVGQRDGERVVLKGHDANFNVPRGKGIDYNYRAGFTGHWISKWTDTKAYPEWKLNVAQGGNYEVSILYCLPAEDVGVAGYLELGIQRLPFKIVEAFDPQPYSQPFMLDGESTKYEHKAWKRLTLGTAQLNGGQASVRIQLSDIPGPNGIEIKEVELRRLN